MGDDPRMWSTDTIAFVADGEGGVAAVRTRDIPDAGETRDVPAQLVLIAKGFTGPEQSVIDAFAPCKNVYLAGDARMGSTIVARAMADALAVAAEIARDIRR